MPLQLSPQQLKQLHELGIDITSNNISQPILNTSNNNKNTQIISPNIGKNKISPILSNKHPSLLISKPVLIPLLSLSGLSLISFSGLIFLKSKTSPSAVPVFSPQTQIQPSPTQVPKSIQHYLLTSQQYFTQALSALSSDSCQNSTSCPVIDLINQSILAASDAVKSFPQDYRGYEQRGRIYQSLIDSQPQLLTSAINDFSVAFNLNPSSPEITRNLASLYARKGDAQSTLNYLSQTVSLEPTKAQNFYDLAKIEQQVGLISQAISTYDHLLTLVTDPDQKQTVQSEKNALENLVAQNPQTSTPPTVTPNRPLTTGIQINPDGPLLQAGISNGPIIAAPSTDSNITLNNLSTSNSLAGNGIISAGDTQVTLQNQLLTSSSQVYVTVISGDKNSTLQLLSKSKDSFTVGIDSPLSQDLHFKWWIVK